MEFCEWLGDEPANILWFGIMGRPKLATLV